MRLKKGAKILAVLSKYIWKTIVTYTFLNKQRKHQLYLSRVKINISLKVKSIGIPDRVFLIQFVTHKQGYWNIGLKRKEKQKDTIK